MQYVPYRGPAPALTDLVAGQIDIIIDQTSDSISRIRAYVVTDDKHVESAKIFQAPTKRV